MFKFLCFLTVCAVRAWEIETHDSVASTPDDLAAKRPIFLNNIYFIYFFKFSCILRFNLLSYKASNYQHNQLRSNLPLHEVSIYRSTSFNLPVKFQFTIALSEISIYRSTPEVSIYRCISEVSIYRSTIEF